MNEKQRRFVDSYLISGSAKKAAIEAGYAPSRARRTGSDLLNRPDIARAIAAAQADRSSRLGIDADWVVRKAVEVVDRSLEGSPKLHHGKPVKIDGAYVMEWSPTGAVGGLNTLIRTLGIGQPRQVEHTGEVVYTLRVDPRPAAWEAGVVDVDVVEELEGDESDGMDGMDGAPVWA